MSPKKRVVRRLRRFWDRIGLLWPVCLVVMVWFGGVAYIVFGNSLTSLVCGKTGLFTIDVFLAAFGVLSVMKDSRL